MTNTRSVTTLLLLMLALVATTTRTTSTAAQRRYQSPTFNSCVRQFYDPAMYNWFSFENTCSQTLHITYIAINPPYGGWATDLRAGRKDSTGMTRSDVTAKGGFELYVCPEGYLPVDADDRLVKRPHVSFRCKED